MKNEPWIDQVYKEKTESWKIAVEPAHWEQAAALIDAQNQRNRKRLIWLWLLGLALLSTSLFVFFNNPNENSPQSVPSLPATEPMAERSRPEQAIPADQVSQPKISPEALADVKNPIAIEEPLKSESIVSNNTKSKQSNQQSIRQNNSTPTQFSPLITAKPLHPKSEDNPSMDLSLSNIDENDGANNHGALNRIILNTESLQYESMVAGAPSDPLILPEIYVPILIEHRVHNWKEFGLRLGLAKQTQTVRTNAISALGFELYSQKQMGSKGYWGISLGYNSFFNSSLYSEVLTSYEFKGFGSVVQNFGIKPEWMHYLYMQASMGMQLKKHRAFMGIKPELLLGALGQVNQLKFKEGSGIRDLASAEVSSIGNGWLQKGALNQVLFNTQLGYEYQFHPKISVGIQANRLINSLYQPLPGDITQTNAAKWNIGMRVSYKIK